MNLNRQSVQLFLERWCFGNILYIRIETEAIGRFEHLVIINQKNRAVPPVDLLVNRELVLPIESNLGKAHEVRVLGSPSGAVEVLEIQFPKIESPVLVIFYLVSVVVANPLR